MTIATDPNSVTLEDEQDGFDKAFDEFAAGKAAPDPENKGEADQPDGNGPEDDTAPDQDVAADDQTSETATSGEAPSEGGDQPPEEQQAPDIWANAPDELRAEFQRLEKEKAAALHKAASDANRVAALSRKLQNITNAQTSSATAPDKATEAKEALDDKIKQLREDYGEIADPLIELIESQKTELNQVRTALSGMGEAQQAQMVAHEEAALEGAHPDWRQIAQSPDFAGWLSVQPDNIQRLASSWDARETSVALTLFKTDRIAATGGMEQSRQAPHSADAATGARRSQQLEGGRDVRSRPASATSEPPDDFDAAFKYFEEKRRRKAQANSR